MMWIFICYAIIAIGVLGSDLAVADRPGWSVLLALGWPISILTEVLSVIIYGLLGYIAWAAMAIKGKDVLK